MMRGGFRPNTSFPQYPFAHQGMMGMKYVFHPIVNISFFPFGSPVPLQSFPVPSLHPYIPIHPYIQLSCFKILEQKTPYFLSFFKIVFREKKYVKKNREIYRKKKERVDITKKKKSRTKQKEHIHEEKTEKKIQRKKDKKSFFWET